MDPIVESIKLALGGEPGILVGNVFSEPEEASSERAGGPTIDADTHTRAHMRGYVHVSLTYDEYYPHTPGSDIASLRHEATRGSVGGLGGDAAVDEMVEPLVCDLYEYSRRYDVPPVVEVLVGVPEDFPRSPPALRVLTPVFREECACVINGYVTLPALLPEGWSPGFTVNDALQWLRSELLNKGARVNVDSQAMYNQQAFAATRRRFTHRPTNAEALVHPQAFRAKYFAYSHVFALEVMGLEIPEGFEAGNRALMPVSALHGLVEREGASASDSSVSPSRADAAAHEFADQGALVYEVTSAMPFPSYCGVREFTCPHPDIMILPEPMMRGMLIQDGAEVSVRRVKLPAAESVVLQPHTVNFNAVEAFTGRTPRQFLEASLTRYACLQQGDVIVCDGGPANHHSADELQSTTESPSLGGQTMEFRFTVVAVRPESAPAAALWTGFASQLPIELLPAREEYIAPRKPKSASIPVLPSALAAAPALPPTSALAPSPPSDALRFPGTARVLGGAELRAEPDAAATSRASAVALGPASVASRSSRAFPPVPVTSPTLALSPTRPASSLETAQHGSVATSSPGVRATASSAGIGATTSPAPGQTVMNPLVVPASPASILARPVSASLPAAAERAAQPTGVAAAAPDPASRAAMLAAAARQRLVAAPPPELDQAGPDP